MKTYQIGMAGLAVMGRNLALNLLDKGYSVAGYNRAEEAELAPRFLEEAGDKPAAATTSLQEFCSLLERPRKMILMVQAGAPVDSVLQQLLPHLEAGDIVIDAGNSYFKDTIRREASCKQAGIHFIGMGVSGGEQGARFGPAIMPGGPREVYPLVEPFLCAAAAHVDGDPCCTYIGENGAGHFVKMVHNGIEYGDMQLICEAYYLLKHVLGLSALEMQAVFTDWNDGELDSYLIEITAAILGETDPETGRPMVDVILGAAGNKGTGKWTSQESLDLGVALPTITQAVYARYLSAVPQQREQVARHMRGPAASGWNGSRAEFVESLRRALYASKICSYAQGFALLRAASSAYDWKLDYAGIASIFRGGCIIRARFLTQIKTAFTKNPALEHLLLDSYFADVLQRYQQPWRQVVATAIQNGIAVPGLSASLAYFDGLRDAEGPLNLLQAQRDYFGAHTFRRTDRDGVFHHQWYEEFEEGR